MIEGLTFKKATISLEASDQPAIIMGARVITYNELSKIVSATAQDLKILGIKATDRIGICHQNDANYLIVLLSLWAVGAVACPLNPLLPIEAIEEQLKQIGCKFLFGSGVDLVSLKEVSIKKFNLSDIVQTQILDLKTTNIKPLEFPLNNSATILFTSGSSANPKAAISTIGNHYHNALASNENIPFKTGDHWLLSLPLYHVSGISILFRALAAKATVVIPNPGENIIETILKYNVTHLSLVTTQLFRLLQSKANEAPLKTVKSILIGGSSIPRSLIEKAIAINLPIHLSYGLTEVSSQVATSEKITADPKTQRAKILKHVQVKISDEREILIKGETLFKGYISGTSIKLPIDKDGWFHTGDLGLLIEGAYLMVRGRKDNMFVSGGENIQPEEIEQLLCQINGVEQAIVVPVENQEFGYRPVAFIRRDPDSKINKKQLIETLRSKLQSYKIPEEFYLWLKEWEMNNSIKTSRKRLAELVKNKNPNLEAIL